MSSSSVSRRLEIRQWLFLGISAALVLFLCYELWIGIVPWYDAVGAYIVGLPIGYLLGRALKIRWHDSDEEAISENDAVGTIAIIIYVAFALSRDWILGQWFAAAIVLPLSLAVAAGILLGRYLAIRRSINRVLREQKKI